MLQTYYSVCGATLKMLGLDNGSKPSLTRLKIRVSKACIDYTYELNDLEPYRLDVHETSFWQTSF